MAEPMDEGDLVIRTVVEVASSQLRSVGWMDFDDTAMILSQLLAGVPEEYVHAAAVAHLARRLVAELKLPTSESTQIVLGALLHDVGKLALPVALLYKPAPLNHQEQQLVRRHVDIGAALVSAVPQLADVADIVFSSHEQYDGSGYPRRLQGDSIPLGGRIVSLVDAYDVMTRRGIYSPRVTPLTALKEIQNGAGSHFDPELIQPFTSSLKDHGQLSSE